jgi:hypothetical protein
VQFHLQTNAYNLQAGAFSMESFFQWQENQTFLDSITAVAMGHHHPTATINRDMTLAKLPKTTKLPTPDATRLSMPN